MAEHDDTLVLAVPEQVLRRHGARILDPTTAAAPPDPGRKATDDRRRLATDDPTLPPRPGTTAYLGHSLLVRGLPGLGADATIDRLRAAAEGLGQPVELVSDPRDEELRDWVQKVDAEQVDAVDRVHATRVTLVGRPGQTPLDPWELLVAAQSDGQGPLDADLEHLVLAAGGGRGGYWEGHGGGRGGYWEGHGGGRGGYWEGHGGVGGAIGARNPVAMTTPDPWRAPAKGGRPPVVAVPDTGIGTHPWFGTEGARHPHVHVLRTLAGLPVGPVGGLDPDPEDRGVREDLTGVLDSLSGHGTFIAGVLRQTGPSAAIVSLPVLGSDGVGAEGDLHRALVALLVLHISAQAQGSTDVGEHGGVLDVLSLSVGFYHQEGQLTTHPVKDLLDRYAEHGVLVVAAAGNDATHTPLYPAGWALHAGDVPDTDVPPLVAVGALNPDGRTVALFSNAGPWVTTHAPGVNVVSTLPTTFQASAGPLLSTPHDEAVRATPDRDDLSQGFGVWSGTSFAAPHLAGRLAQRIAEQGAEAGDDGTKVDRGTMIERAVRALARELGWKR